MQSNLLTEGINLMILGMGVVFVFLSLLVVATTAMSRFIQYFLPELTPVVTTAVTTTETPHSSASHPGAIPSARVQAVIKAALDQHRNR